MTFTLIICISTNRIFVNVTMYCDMNYYISTNATFISACVRYNRTKLCHMCPALMDINQGNRF